MPYILADQCPAIVMLFLLLNWLFQSYVCSRPHPTLSQVLSILRGSHQHAYQNQGQVHIAGTPSHYESGISMIHRNGSSQFE
ncbi:hypothetical protein BO94DRAFT_357312 [Aspergillus sclerotioniger CBS 115572]|uniref:Secreted protein n=1 Tax=Aspergillus sclerotioniger CBS 115572 TaxID=1450535 RepID=A0A317X5Y3_9EURO|nr:hypothetical protein BO94DRAFT_357312 [Aspergillus sclerotioniger CBS 115572]PWY92967.1 hypothetical protein BO94DRAFT_357312 [Aspergillus sclerotioniger CBS 115572]